MRFEIGPLILTLKIELSRMCSVHTKKKPLNMQIELVCFNLYWSSFRRKKLSQDVDISFTEHFHLFKVVWHRKSLQQRNRGGSRFCFDFGGWNLVKFWSYGGLQLKSLVQKNLKFKHLTVTIAITADRWICACKNFFDRTNSNTIPWKCQ